MVIDHPPGRIGFQAVAEQRRPAKLAHQGMRELVEGVRQDNHFIVFAKLVEEGTSSGHRPHFADHFLNVRQTEFLLCQDAETIFHQRVVIRFVASGTAQLRNPGALGEGNPDFWDKDALKVEANDLHGILLGYIQNEPIILPKIAWNSPDQAGSSEEW